ncbi:putative disease resistance protein rga1 [Phtheirospermum japonicum]|uniref:Putative disease resistance protein rga1 n=1 Tax=Phtheirospermum japonicum TaxID=374723 RepID=A0A830CFG3_9LAMI|nr:putative disease resistance protein rga1 [Phtheirospermum japonicum]
MAETFLFNITERVLSKVTSVSIEQISSAWNIEPEITKLENTLSTIKAVVLDADEQQSKNHEIRDWLEKPKDAVCDIDDLLDELSTRGSRSSTETWVRRLFSCSNSIASRFKIAQRVKGLRTRLDEIAEDRNKFHFNERTHLTVAVDHNNIREQTHSYVRASGVIGRDNDKENIVQLLLVSSNDGEEVLVVIPIVGIGGLGKTTVVKLAYNDDRVIRSFDLGMWVSVSGDFNVSKVVEKILRSATGESLGHLDMDQIQSRLVGVLSDKKYLLVLDDVWDDDRNKWVDLMELLMSCRPGSKIIVTTRSKSVAKVTSTMPPYDLTGLSDDDCLSLFLKCAFRGPDDWLPNLVAVGKEIVKKCSGVPLAVKTLGSLLYMNTDEQEWVRIKDNDIWEIDQKQSGILPLLKLSYERLPSHLRQCFAYCSMLPKGLEIPREVFINLWIAQGLLHSVTGNRQLEDLGNQYFNELSSRFCFQEVVEAFDGEILACKIHNLVHDLAQSVAGRECLNVRSDTKGLPDGVRHVYFHDESMSRKETFRALLGLKNVRSFRCAFKARPSDRTLIQAIVRSFRRLRVLILNSLELEELPSSVGSLRLLKYFDLSHSSNIKSLPKSVCKLLNLQTLNLINCESLQDLPTNFEDLMSIRTLYLTCQEMSLRKKAPQSFSSLQFLLLYKCDFVQLPPELQHFTSIRVLRIYDCPRLASLPESIKYLSTLEKLWIWNCEELNLSDGDGLQGLAGLQSLLLMGLPKLIHLPVGLTENVVKTLKFLRVANCAHFRAFPDWLMSFTLLQRLYIEDCPNLFFLPEGARNHIAKLHISGCPNLTGFDE